MMYRCNVCKSTNCIKIANTEKPAKMELIPHFKCNCFKCKAITNLEYYSETKIRPFKEIDPFNNLPENFTNE